MKPLFLLLTSIIIFSCCNKDVDKSIPEINKLPPATQTGANTAGCLVNGIAFIPKGNLREGSSLICNYIDGKNFNLKISEKRKGRIRSINIASENQNLHNNIGVIFQLKEYGANSKYGEFVIFNPDSNENHYQTNSSVTGQLKITNHNFNDAIISGEFWFDAINPDGEVINVRAERLDMLY